MSNDNHFLITVETFLYKYSTLTLTGLAGRLNLSTQQTRRLLMKHYRKNSQIKKTEEKMSAAAPMLRSSEINISTIAEKNGRSPLEHFSPSPYFFFRPTALGRGIIVFSWWVVENSFSPTQRYS